MANLPKICPNCGRRYEWYEAECSVCHIALVTDESASADDESSDEELEARRRLDERPPAVAFETDDPVLLALAEQALDDSHIPFLRQSVQATGTNRWAWRADADVPAKLVVNAEDFEKAAAALAKLSAEPDESSPIDAPAKTRSNTEVMATNVKLQDADSHQPIGEITSDELEFLFAQLERESDTDDDFFIDAATIEMLEDAKAPAHLVEMLKKAVGSGEGVEVRWTKTTDN